MFRLFNRGVPCGTNSSTRLDSAVVATDLKEGLEEWSGAGEQILFRKSRPQYYRIIL